MNVIITGASKGIGYALAKQFSANSQNHLFLIARSKERLHHLKKECLEQNPDTEITTVVFDLENLLKGEFPVLKNCEHIDILINNAGFLIRKDFKELSSDEIIGMTTVNFVTPTLFIQKLMDKMGGRIPSHVVNISSMAGYQGSSKFPGLSIYSASKAALASLTECLAEEFNAENIFFNALALGAVQTDMLTKAFPDYKAPISADDIAKFIADFAIHGYKYFNGKILPVSLSTP
jgi:short-subunit dehydrogenase